ncbi:hypothetical protein [Streptomyces sp. A012304]|uniref:hypothetical protein n=1 Tax=Streptomyces sp. A012304 TaxID=375446 RepID=UPI002232583F|nr:hypothetical protein [Streptomyces sp. A012304]GKQ36553.1 hypothetical protein ALMP_30940 [Streptomyces sp. A012304]
MATPTPGEPFNEAAGEAVQTAVVVTRLLMVIADAVRRYQQRRQKRDEANLPSAEQAVGEVDEVVKRLLSSDVSAALTGEADWSQLAQQLVALRRAGVDLEQILPRVGEITVNVQVQFAANAHGAAADGQWERVVRETLPAGPAREAILSPPAWPEVVATMARLEERGINAREVLVAAHDEALGVGQAAAKSFGAVAEPATSRDAQLSYGPLTTGLDVPKDLDLGDRARALRQLAVSPAENERYTRWVREVMPERVREADLLISARQWPLVAARMATMESEGKPVRELLAQLSKDLSWEEGPRSQLGSRLLQAANEALRRPHGATAVPRATVNTSAARATSTTVGPKGRGTAKKAVPGQAGIAPQRRESMPTPRRARTR